MVVDREEEQPHGAPAAIMVLMVGSGQGTELMRFFQDPANLLVHSIWRVSVAALCQFGEGLLTAPPRPMGGRSGCSTELDNRRDGSADCVRFVGHEGQAGPKWKQSTGLSIRAENRCEKSAERRATSQSGVNVDLSRLTLGGPFILARSVSEGRHKSMRGNG